jgi:hypothetical protein
MKCPKCDIDLIPGYAINPHGLGNSHSGCGCFGGGPYLLEAKDVEIVFTGKCSICGHNEELTRDQQSKLHAVTPPGYANWNAYWAADKKELPRKWLEQVFAGS